MITSDHQIDNLPTEERLQDRIRFEKLIATIFSHFLNLESGEIDRGIEFALQAISDFIDADRSYILILSNSSRTEATGIIETVYEWHTRDLSPELYKLQGVSTKTIPWTIQKLNLHQTINISEIEILPQQAQLEWATLNERKTKSLTLLPMIYGGRLVGILGFEFIKAHKLWPEDILPLLKIVGEMFVNAFERHTAEQALRESEERFRQVITSISDHVYFWKVTEKGEHINLYLSPNIEELTDYPYSQFENDWTFWNQHVIHPEDQPAAAEQADRLAVGENSIIEYRLVRADGEIIWVRDSGRAERVGKSIFVYGVVAEITEKKQAEEALAKERALLAQRVQERTAELQLANAELARTARMKDEFLAAMSHELRTPLNAVLGMSEALQELVYGPLNSKQLSALHRIEESGRQLLSLINDILDLSRIEAGKLELQIGLVDIETLCSLTLRFVEKDAADKQLTVDLNVQTDIRLYADERRLKQALINLLNNAVKFTPEGGKIGLEVAFDPEKQAVNFTVWDTGIGIAQENMGLLFKPFVQLDSRLSRQYEGTGLGLTLVYRIVEMHQGSILLDSTLGKGSRFTVSLPTQHTKNENTMDDKMAQATPPNDTNDTELHENAFILLVEDNEANITTISEYLSFRNFDFGVARNGAQALERIREETPDLILMDIQMPVLDGLETIRRIRTNLDLQEVPIIALTALAMPGDRERCLAAGANEYLSKPMSLKQLVAIIDKYLSQG